MISSTRMQRRYDHRLRELVRSTGNIEHALQRGVPRSTARGWLKSTRGDIVTLDVADRDVIRLQHEVLALRKRIEQPSALLRLLVVLLKMSGLSLASNRPCTVM